MLRKTYFVFTLIFAACFTFGGVGGVIFEAYQILNEVHSESNASQYLGWGITSVGAVGYIIASYLFVREDDKDDTDPDDESPTEIEDPST